MKLISEAPGIGYVEGMVTENKWNNIVNRMQHVQQYQVTPDTTDVKKREQIFIYRDCINVSAR